ncbi:hypothetical protein [Bradyrhizobium sp. S3.12.5]|uniref:hypothetical protein n=1 Tax=Bradyrhizobium sp. S3.12.5 TaxID=3156386 RepID=UPI00339963B3
MTLAPEGIIAMASSTETAFMVGTPLTRQSDVGDRTAQSFDLRQGSRHVIPKKVQSLAYSSQGMPSADVARPHAEASLNLRQIKLAPAAPA